MDSELAVTLTQEEARFLLVVLDRATIQGIVASRACVSITEKLASKLAPPPHGGEETPPLGVGAVIRDVAPSGASRNARGFDGLH